MILREGKTPSGKEARTVLKHVIRRIRRHWPGSISWCAATAITAAMK